MQVTHFIPVVSLAAALGCNNPGTPHPLTAADAAVVGDSVRSMLTHYCDAVRKDGLLAEFPYLDSSADFFWVPPGYASAISYDSVAATLRANAPRFKKVDNTFTSLRIVPLSAQAAMYTGEIHSEMTDSSGGVNSFDLLETGCAVKRADGWKLISGQTALKQAP